MFIKRIFDILASFFGLLILWPVLLIVALLIKLKMPGPVFFVQPRVGQHGKQFKVVKFRTMSVHHSGSTISIKGESRITPLGATLRKYKLDELPELWNVLKGQMSFVGPLSREIFILFQRGCPDVPGYADKLKGEERKILQLKPGITGLSREKCSNFHWESASIKYANEEELLALQSDPVKYNNEVILWGYKMDSFNGGGKEVG